MEKDLKLITKEYLQEHGYKLLKNSDKYATFIKNGKQIETYQDDKASITIDKSKHEIEFHYKSKYTEKQLHFFTYNTILISRFNNLLSSANLEEFTI